MKTISQLLFALALGPGPCGLVLGAIALTLAFALMVSFHAAPALVFANMLFCRRL